MKRLFIAALFGSLLFAGKPIVPSANVAAKKGVRVVSVEEAKKMWDRGAIFVDARKKSEYFERHIKGAVSAPYKEKGGNKNRKANWDSSKEKWNDSKVKKYKNQDIVIYCNGIRCWKSYKASVVAVERGYKKVYWLRDGIKAWIEKGYPTE